MSVNKLEFVWSKSAYFREFSGGSVKYSACFRAMQPLVRLHGHISVRFEGVFNLFGSAPKDPDLCHTNCKCLFMKKLLFFVALFTSAQLFAVVHEVEVGGGGANGTPYYDPQNLSIALGDVVNWVWVSGSHNVTSTSGPASFASGNLNSPNEWSFTFEVAGVYDYECTLFNHATTQFGTITVGANSVAEKVVANPNFEIYPNPANDFVTIDKNVAYTSDIRLFDITGKLVFSDNNNNLMRTRISIADQPKGIYFIEVNVNGRAQRRRLIIE